MMWTSSIVFEGNNNKYMSDVQENTKTKLNEMTTQGLKNRIH